MIVQIYSLLFYLWWVYGVVNGKNKPWGVTVAVFVPMPLLLRIWGIV